MTVDLKGPYDMVIAAQNAYQAKAAEIAELLNQGTDEAVTQALALQQPLDELQADLDEKKALYQKLVKANQPSDVAALFVPANEPTPEEEDKPKDVMSLSEYKALSPKERLAFAKAGGKLTEGE